MIIQSVEGDSWGSLGVVVSESLLWSKGLKRMEVQTWYLKSSKLALALAIIRSKPPNRNSREYTEHLAKMLSGQDGEWKSKVEALETEVLQLRQKLLLSKICPVPQVNNRNPINSLPSKELESPEDISNQLEDSGCDVLSETRTDPSELSQNIEESFTSSSEISSYQLPIVKNHCALHEKTLTSHLQFLQHVLELKNLTESGSLKTDLNKFESDCSTVSDSVFRLLDGLIAFYSNPKLPFSNFLTEAVCILTSLIDDCNLSNHILKKCFKKLEEFEKTLVQVILKNTSINRFQVQHYISNSLVILGKCSFLRKPVIALLLLEVNNFTDKLRNMHQVQSRYDLSCYENIFSLFWILEQLLQEGTKNSNMPSIDPVEQETKKFLEQLDQTILHLSDEFPLFTLYIWRVGVLLNSTQIRTVENNSPP
ncbi:meiosis-specific protein MEI4 [Gracilinanus agilis]|uniref:meiosis-specific protein MEI4 n=1 Tax=Gracilinanus agilis TaxID=191870 RepID=UPI001CFC9C03|nr:meiosis-specific protein MEI4 [Gracilinanus agilis]